MTNAKITLADFAKSTALREHASRSRAVACALDEKAVVLPNATAVTRSEGEELLPGALAHAAVACAPIRRRRS